MLLFPEGNMIERPRKIRTLYFALSDVKRACFDGAERATHSSRNITHESCRKGA